MANTTLPPNPYATARTKMEKYIPCKECNEGISIHSSYVEVRRNGGEAMHFHADCWLEVANEEYMPGLSTDFRRTQDIEAMKREIENLKQDMYKEQQRKAYEQMQMQERLRRQEMLWFPYHNGVGKMLY